MADEMGVLVPDRCYRQLAAGKLNGSAREALRQEREYGLRLRFLSPRGVDLAAGGVRGLTFRKQGRPEEQEAPIPAIIHNLLVNPGPRACQTLRGLNGRPRTLVFNETNRWDRALVADMLTSSDATRSLVLPTAEVGAPIWEGAGPGLYLLLPRRRTVREGSLLESSRRGRVRHRRVMGREWAWLEAEVHQAARLLAGDRRRWLVRLPGRPVGPQGPAEWRFYLYRPDGGPWAIAGEVAKLDLLRTPQWKERCWPTDEALAAVFGRGAAGVAGNLRQGALAVANVLSRYQPGMVHLCADFWLDGAGRAALADLTGRYRLDWLEKIGERDALLRLTDHPVRLARTLLETGVEKLHVDFGRAR